MPDAPALTPVFNPPLAAMLALAEQEAGRELTEVEMHEIRDRGVSIMLANAHIPQMDRLRGYRDVDPANCWADWRRLRAQMTGKAYLPKLVLCLPGPDALRANTTKLLEQQGLEHEYCSYDKYLEQAFEVSICRVRPSLTEVDLKAIERHSTVLYVLSENCAPADAAAVCLRFLRLGGSLLDAGAIAIKCESSGIAQSATHWRELTERAEAGFVDGKPPTPDAWLALYEAFVQLPIGSHDTEYISCGMHLLGHPDFVVSSALLLGADESLGHRAAHLFDAFAHHLLTECGGKWFTSGNTFSMNAESRKYRLVWEPCTGYEEDDFFNNPFGRWRFGAE